MSKKKKDDLDLKNLLTKVLTVTYKNDAFPTRTGEALKLEEKENGTVVLYIQNENGEVWGLTNNPKGDREVRVFPEEEALIWKLATENKRKAMIS